MRRKVQTNKKVTSILTADKHFREDVPVCRTDNFLDAQWRKLEFENDLMRKYECPILDAGDLFNKWKPSPWLLREVIQRGMGYRVTIPGNHDLPNHLMDSYEKSGLSVIEQAGTYTVLKNETIDSSNFSCIICNNFSVTGIPYGQEVGASISKNKTKVLLLHEMVWQGKNPFPNAEGYEALDLLKKYPDFDLIVTGHNHQSFVQEYEGRLLVNPGSMMRATADQMDFEPSLYLWYAEDNTVERVHYPFEKNVISREHLEKKEEKNERLQSFITGLRADAEVGLNFEKNLEEYMAKNKISDSVKDIVWESMGDKT